MEKMGRVTIAAIREEACGEGLELALACTLRIAASGARFSMPQLKRGLIPGLGGTQRLPRLIGKGRALDLIITGREIDTEEAISMGLIHRVVPEETLLKTAEEMAHTVMKKGPIAVRLALEAIYHGLDTTLEMGSALDEAGRDVDEGLVHEVCVDGFWMGRTEVTNAQYRQFQSDHDSRSYNGHSLSGDNQPAVNVSWHDAKAFADWLTQETTGLYTFKLPTEAEWEYACRAGTVTARFWGEYADEACQYANVHDKTSKRINKFEWQHHDCDDGYAVTAPVGSFRPNGFGLYDMLGNVWEWCEDTYGEDAYSTHKRNNPIYTDSGSFWVNRGGSWSDVPRGVRCAIRDRLDPEFGNFYLGFRVVRTP